MQVSTPTQISKQNMKRRLSFIVFAILAFSICLKLGFWQLDRAEQKRQLLTTAQTTLTSLQGISQTDLHKSIQLSGYFDNQHPILLDNQTNEKQPGYHLYLPFISQGSAILVNLGWLKAPPQRQQLPEIQTFEGILAISGQLSSPQGSPLLLGKNEALTQQGILRVQKTLISDIQPYIAHPLAPLMLQLDSESNIGFSKNWSITVMSPEKHLAYAIQWFALGAAILVISLLWLKTTL